MSSAMSGISPSMSRFSIALRNSCMSAPLIHTVAYRYGSVYRVPAPTRTPRTSWIEEGLRALGVGGPDAVRIEALAQALGVTKGGFYWHFEDRPALLGEMLDTWERVVTEDVITRVESGGGDARAKLRHLFGIAVAIDDMVSIELAVREWARRD